MFNPEQFNPGNPEVDEKKQQDQERRENMIEDTAGFCKALEDGKLEEAEHWLGQASQLEKYDDRWLDHRQRELFKAFCAKKDWIGAKRVVEATKDEMSREGRKARLEELSEMKYEEI